MYEEELERLLDFKMFVVDAGAVFFSSVKAERLGVLIKVSKNRRRLMKLD